MKKLKIYLAGPLFNELERQRNSLLKQRLEQVFDVFLPQQDGLLLDDIIRHGGDPDFARKEVFNTDIKELKNSDILIAILDGAVIDPGVAVEIGFFWGLGKPCIGLQTDVRRQLVSGNNPMIDGVLAKIFTGDQELVEFLMTTYSKGTENQTLFHSQFK